MLKNIRILLLAITLSSVIAACAPTAKETTGQQNGVSAESQKKADTLNAPLKAVPAAVEELDDSAPNRGNGDDMERLD